jgi:uncharacterized protein YggT (Ycf19 family)
MILGLSIPAFIALHVGISLIGIATGLVALPTLAGGRWLPRWHAVFLATTLATSLTGFLFPFRGFTPAIGVGAISTLVLAVALAALYAFGLRGRARVVYAISAMAALYLNLFVLVVQAFLKLPTLNALAPTGTEPPFIAAQAVLLLASVALGHAAVAASRKGRTGLA